MFKLSCCRGIMFRLPFGTITASLLAVCGLIICGSTLKSLTRIAEKMCFEILKKNYLWFNDLKVLYLVLGIIICVTIFFNLILGFSATGSKLPQSPNHFQRGCTGCCTSDGNFTVSASNFFVKSIFILNYVLYYTILALTLLATCSLLLTFLLHELCTSGKCINTVLLTPNQQSLCVVKENDETGASNGMIDLRQFSPIFKLKSNETELLLIKGVPLKKLCTDFRRELIPNLIVCFVGFILLLWGFVNFLINISVNYAKISTKRKYAEILYINSATEMMPFTSDG